MKTLIVLLLAACFVAPYLGAPTADTIASGGTHETVGPGVRERGVAALAASALVAGCESEWRDGCGGLRTPRRVAALATGDVQASVVRPPVRASVEALAAVTRQGLVSWVAPRYGRFYLALPYPRGTRATICGAGGCVTRTSTDYGPSQRIHPDRIADLSAVDFEYVCAMPRRFGLCNATLTILKRGTGPAPRAVPTAPATDEGS